MHSVQCTMHNVQWGCNCPNCTITIHNVGTLGSSVLLLRFVPPPEVEQRISKKWLMIAGDCETLSSYPRVVTLSKRHVFEEIINDSRSASDFVDDLPET